MRVLAFALAVGVVVGLAQSTQSVRAESVFRPFGSGKSQNPFKPQNATAVQAALTGSASAIGSAAEIVADVRGSHGPGQRRLATSDPVFANERITASSGSVGQFQLRDDTRIVVGPGSSIVLDKFVYDPNKSVQTVSINAVKGAFRFITGNGPKSAYSIKTPSALMGIRGTIFDFHVDTAGRTSVLLLEGQVDVCGRGGKCRTLKDRCEFVQVGRNGRFSGKREVRGGEARGVKVASVFPFVKRQGFLSRRFKARTAECNSSSTPNGPSNTAPEPASTTASVDPSVEPEVSPAAGPGNPGNDRGVGNSGESPNGNDFGGGTNGQGDSGGGSANNGNGGGNNGNGGGNGGGGGRG